ncbi:MAG TPA: hypothetical protein VLM11_16295 [Streptosporangiaceae bacterium]|nr:hypothetical protein [Streptosporangiaceae bacterium]
MGIDISWDCEASKTPEGFYQVQGEPDALPSAGAAIAHGDDQ